MIDLDPRRAHLAFIFASFFIHFSCSKTPEGAGRCQSSQPRPQPQPDSCTGKSCEGKAPVAQDVARLDSSAEKIENCSPSPRPEPIPRPQPKPYPGPGPMDLKDVSLGKVCGYLGNGKSFPKSILITKMLQKYGEIYTQGPSTIQELAKIYCKYKKDDSIGFDCSKQTDAIYLQLMIRGVRTESEEIVGMFPALKFDIRKGPIIDGTSIAFELGEFWQACEKPDAQMMSAWCSAKSKNNLFCTCKSSLSNSPVGPDDPRYKQVGLLTSSEPAIPDRSSDPSKGKESTLQCNYGGKLAEWLDHEVSQCEKSGGAYAARVCTCEPGKQYIAGSGCQVPSETSKCESWGGKTLQGFEGGQKCQCADGKSSLAMTEFARLASKEAFELVCKSN